MKKYIREKSPTANSSRSKIFNYVKEYSLLANYEYIIKRLSWRVEYNLLLSPAVWYKYVQNEMVEKARLFLLPCYTGGSFIGYFLVQLVEP